VTVQGARELDHAPISIQSRSRSSTKGVDTFVSIKVEGTHVAKSHPSRTDKWNEEFEIAVDKANEVEIIVYDKQVNDPNAVPIGLLWIRITDLVDALRRQKLGMDSQGGWVTAGAMPGESPTVMAQQGGPGDLNVPVGYNPPGAPGAGFQGQVSDGIDAWFAVEPAGALALHLNFCKDMFFDYFIYLTLSQ
jgi:classical protein kinase C